MGAMEAARSEPAAAQGRSTGRALRAFRRLGWLSLAAFLSAAALVLSARFFWLGEVAVNFSWHMGWAGLLGALLLYLVRLRLAAGVTLVGAWLLLAPELWLWVPASHPKGAHDSIAAIPVGRRLTVVSCNRLAGADNLELVKLRLQELANEYAANAVGGNGEDHTSYASYVSGHEDDKEDLQWMGFDALRVDKRLKYNIVQ